MNRYDKMSIPGSLGHGTDYVLLLAHKLSISGGSSLQSN